MSLRISLARARRASRSSGSGTVVRLPGPTAFGRGGPPAVACSWRARSRPAHSSFATLRGGKAHRLHEHLEVFPGFLLVGRVAEQVRGVIRDGRGNPAVPVPLPAEPGER